MPASRLNTVLNHLAVEPVAAAAAAGADIKYTLTDEAPYLATYALLPVIQRFCKPAGITIETVDISVAARILGQFGQFPDTLGGLGKVATTPDGNIIKLPNVSASVPQLLEAIAELQAKGFNVPNYPADPKSAEEKAIKEKYGKVAGSAVNPVLREGNSDRRVAPPVKAFAQKEGRVMGAWTSDQATHVSSMSGGDFYESEQSFTMPAASTVRIELHGSDGSTTVLKDGLKMQSGEVIDASRMSAAALKSFFAAQFAESKASGILASLHLKATMMKVSDPIIFGIAVETYFAPVFAKHGSLFKELGITANNGIGDVYAKMGSHPAKAEVYAGIEECYKTGCKLAMVDSDNGITNLHVPSDVIIDASMPNVIRDSGGMYNAAGKLEATKAMIPDRSYAGIYSATVDFCKANGQFDVATMGNVANVGLMAQKAEEYGSHDKTFQIAKAGSVKVVDASSGKEIFNHSVAVGDIWRMCQTKDAPIKDWVKLAVSRARATGDATIFWLDPQRAHDREMLKKVEAYLPLHDTKGLPLTIQSPVDAITTSMQRCKEGKNSISVTGNVLRDYLTDLFPILELGTSAKMLSIVPMLNGGAMFETGAGGSAPKHVEQFVKEGHLRWDSLGEYLAIAVSLEELGKKTNNKRAMLLGDTLTAATGKLLDNNQSPGRKVMQPDNRASTYYIARYWAEIMAQHDPTFADLAKGLSQAEAKIIDELTVCQGKPVDIGGYYKQDPVKVTAAMRPSATFNNLIDH